MAHQISHTDLMLGPRYEGGELLAAEHPQPVHAYHIGETSPVILHVYYCQVVTFACINVIFKSQLLNFS